MKSIIAVSVLMFLGLTASKAHATTVYEFTTTADTGTPVQICSSAAPCALVDIEASSTTYAVGDGVACFSSATTSGFTSVTQDGTAAAPSIGRLTILTANTPINLSDNVTNYSRPAPNGMVCLTGSQGTVNRRRWHVIVAP